MAFPIKNEHEHIQQIIHTLKNNLLKKDTHDGEMTLSFIGQKEQLCDSTVGSFFELLKKVSLSTKLQ